MTLYGGLSPLFMGVVEVVGRAVGFTAPPRPCHFCSRGKQPPTSQHGGWQSSRGHDKSRGSQGYWRGLLGSRHVVPTQHLAQKVCGRPMCGASLLPRTLCRPLIWLPRSPAMPLASSPGGGHQPPRRRLADCDAPATRCWSRLASTRTPKPFLATVFLTSYSFLETCQGPPPGAVGPRQLQGLMLGG